MNVIIYSAVARNGVKMSILLRKDKKAHIQVSLRVYSENNAEPVFF